MNETACCRPLRHAHDQRQRRQRMLSCKPVFERLGDIAAEFAPENSAKITLGAGGQSLADRATAGAQPSAQHVHVERRRPAYQRNPNQPRHRIALRAPRRLRPPGRQCEFSQSCRSTMSAAKNFCRKRPTRSASAARKNRSGRRHARQLRAPTISSLRFSTSSRIRSKRCSPSAEHGDVQSPTRAARREAMCKLEFRRRRRSVHDADGRAVRLRFAGDKLSRNVRASPPPSNIAPIGKTHLQYRADVVEPLHERRSDTWILFELAKRMGMTEQFFDGDVEAGYAYELRRAGITLDQLKQRPGRHLTSGRAPTYEKHAKENKDGRTARLRHAVKKSRTLLPSISPPTGYPAMPEYIEPALSPGQPPRYRRRFPSDPDQREKSPTTSTASSARCTSLRKTLPEPSADIHPETALRYGVKNKEWMIVETPRGAIKVKARVTTNIVAGVVCCPTWLVARL